jgi:hypothetical protein
MAEFGILVLILFLRKVWKKKVLAGLGKAVLLTLLLCAGFLVPFLDFYLKLDIWGSAAGNQMVTGVRVALPQLFSLICNPVGEANWYGMTGEMNQGIGLALLLPLAASFGMLGMRLYGDRTPVVKRLLILTAISLFLSSELFPSWWLYGHLPGIYRIWALVQFGFRYLEVSVITVMAILIETVAATCRVEKETVRIAGYRLTVAVVALTFLQAVIFLSGFLLEARGEKALNIRDYKWGYEYMPEGSSPEHLRYHQEILSSSGTLGFEITGEDGLGINLKVENAGEEAYLLLPRIWYPGYQMVDQEGKRVSLGKGEMAMVKAVIPAGYTGEITVTYREPRYWRIAELISLITMLTVIIFKAGTLRKRNRL